jgi:hypothetical protein
VALTLRSVLPVSLLALVFAVGGCGDEWSHPRMTPAPTLRTIWPNDDGGYWTYRMEQRTWFPYPFPFDSLQTWPSGSDVPPVPTFDQVAALLADRSPEAGVPPDSATYHMQFAGDTTTELGVTTQNLREWFGAGSSSGSGSSRHLGDSFLSRLLQVRPGLRPRLASLLRAHPGLRRYAEGMLPATDSTASPPLFLHGGAWRRSTEYIGHYGMLDTDMSWIFLAANLRPGAMFRWQLVKELAPDVYLTGQVRRELSVATPAGRVERAIEVLYVLDYGVDGIGSDTGQGTDSLRVTRFFGYGSVVYAPNVGPVSLYERGPASFGPRWIYGWASSGLTLVETGPRLCR